jgi:hypothetical protein
MSSGGASVAEVATFARASGVECRRKKARHDNVIIEPKGRLYNSFRKGLDMTEPEVFEALTVIFRSALGDETIVLKPESLTRNHAVLCPLRATRRSRRNPIASMTQA